MKLGWWNCSFVVPWESLLFIGTNSFWTSMWWSYLGNCFTMSVKYNLYFLIYVETNVYIHLALDWVNLKHVVWPCQIVASQWCFSMSILVGGAIFLHQMNQSKNGNSMGNYWAIYTLLKLANLANCPHGMAKYDANSRSKTYIILLFCKTLQKFSKIWQMAKS